VPFLGAGFEIADMLLRDGRGWYLGAMLEIAARAHGRRLRVNFS